MTRAELAAMIDHTLLKPGATDEDIERLCSEAVEHGFRTVCVNPCRVELASRILKGKEPGVCSVAGFPLGASIPDVKSVEAARAIQDGATEIDMVMNVGALLSGDETLVANDIAAVMRSCKGRAALKVIIEAALLSDEQKETACRIAVDQGVDFVKTSTGFGPGGATAEDVALMRRAVGEAAGVKAAGGIRDFETAAAMIEAGANRIGASAGPALLEGAEND
ncbi:MAG: deoxyribose-phosphate aldolase [Candidatus Eisenbacteria bacterium]|nr:deoxyribose-phosphate aldolase [Candidatus Eisenbacteria bacterium]